MVRAASRPALLAARAAAVLMLGVAVSACSGAGTPGPGHEQHSSATTVSPEAAVVSSPPATEEPGDDHAAHSEDAHSDDAHADGGHAHGDGATDEVAATAGPPRPADPDLACGLTVTGDTEQVVRYCGHGHMTVAVDGTDEVYVDGAQCEDRGEFFLMHFGASYSDESAARGEYVGLVLEDMPETGEGTPRVSALEFTAGGHRQPVSDAGVQVSWDGDEVAIELVGELAAGEAFEVSGHCALTP